MQVTKSDQIFSIFFALPAYLLKGGPQDLSTEWLQHDLLGDKTHEGSTLEPLSLVPFP